MEHNCSRISTDHKEPWLGTASPAKLWIAISHPKPWGASALASIDIGELNRKHLTTIFGICPDSRVQVITQDDSTAKILFFAVAFENDQRLYRFPLACYDDIQNFSWQSMIDGDKAYDQYLTTEPIYLVCTNDQHDPCCGRVGQALFEEAKSNHHVWQSSHLGGDRFAANVVSLPQGNYYRRVTSDGFKKIIEAEKQSLLDLQHFAGRSCYARIEQVAYYYLLEAQTEAKINQWRLVETQELEARNFSCIFESVAKQKVSIQLSQINTGIEDFLSCHATTKSEIVYFQLQAIKPVL